jgi:hypothetical protein
VDHFEATRPNRRSEQDLRVSPIHRETYLNCVVGISKLEMQASIQEVTEVRRKRDETVRNMKNERLQIVLQSLQRKTARVLGRTRHPVKKLHDLEDINPGYAQQFSLQPKAAQYTREIGIQS